MAAEGTPCKECQSLQAEQDMVICDGCGECWHLECAEETQQPTPHDGPWVCLDCRGRISGSGCPDVTLDFGLTDYLWLGRLPG